MSEQDLKVVKLVIDREKTFLNDVSQNIWKRPELKFEEFYAHDLLTESLEKFGFLVEKNYFLPTAFRGLFHSGDGPSIAVLLEYDALPGIGHACGHNLIAEAGLGAAIAIKAAMENDPVNLKGKLIVLGTPGEESGGGKIKLIEQGAFKNIEAALMAHPSIANVFFPTLLSITSLSVDFKGKESHASAFPWEGINALDAAVILYQSLGLMRQQIKPSCRLHAIITKGGTAPNIIPEESRVEIFCRAPSKQDLLEIRQKIDNCIKGAATSTGCNYDAKWDEENTYYNLITNKTIVDLFAEHFESPQTDPAKLVENLVGSSDMGNVSHVVPSIHPIYSIDSEGPNHSKKYTIASGADEAQAPTLKAAQALAMTALTLIRYPEKLKKAKEEFNAAFGIKELKTV